MNRILALSLLVLAQAAQADIVCRATAGTGIAFGTYEVDSSVHNDSLMNLTVTCDRNGGPQFVTLAMRLGPGLNSGSAGTRRMARIGAPVDHLSYGLYRDVGRSSPWGTTDGVDTMVQTLDVPNKGSRAATFVIYGRIPAGQDVSAGTYSDSVQAIILY